MDVFLEIGKKRSFASAIDWPGWSRSGKDEALALQALLAYGPRYEKAIESAGLGFRAPKDISEFTVIERLKGGAGTDFGAPGVAPSADAEAVSHVELKRFQALLEALWQTFDAAAQVAAAWEAEGKELRKGPRGGGRDLKGILRHVRDADKAYITQLGGKYTSGEAQVDPREDFPAIRRAILTALGAAARGELPQVGPRGGLRWTPHFYVRYSAWHMLDHTWELEDRIL
jgi:hypothetical protein